MEEKEVSWLIKKAQNQDIEAFREIYKIYSKFVFRLSLGLLKNKEDAEDITQEVFLKIYANIKNFRFKSSFKTWIYKITLNTAINALKNFKKRTISLCENQVNSEDNKENKKIELEKLEKQELLDSLLGQLNRYQRICLILRELEGLSYKEIAEILNIKINTVRTHLRRARLSLLKKAKNYEVQ